MPQSTPADVARGVRQGSPRPGVVGTHAAGRPGRHAAAPARPGARPAGRDPRPHRVGVRQGPQARLRRAGAHRADRPLLRAHRRAAPGLPPAARHRPRADAGRGAPSSQGRRRHHLAVELPLHHGAVRRHPRPARRQRRRRQARLPGDAVGPARRPAARGGRPARRPLAGRGRPRPGARARAGRGRRLRLLHRLDRHRPDHREAVRRASHRLLARARRQEPPPRAARRRHREGRRGRRTCVVLQRRPAVRLDGADVRRRPGLRPVRRAVRRAHGGDDAGCLARVGRRHGLADLPAAARGRHRPRARTPSPRAPGC